MIRQMALALLKTQGWTFVNECPEDLRSFVFLGAPHTDNFDIIPTFAVSYLMKRNTKFVIKHEWTKFPFGLFMKPAGALGLDRKSVAAGKLESTTDAMAKLFKENKDLVLMISPEGTRKPNENWKTGFYWIAQKAQVPIVLGFVDYPKKEMGIGMVIYPTNFEEDMKKIMAFYATKTGKKPENFKLDQKFR